MADKLSPEKRSWNMSHIKGKDTGIEVKVRTRLHHDGFRYRKNVKELPGKPDVVFSKYKTVLFIHGCYWHGHDCKEAHIPKSNSKFWKNKFQRNIDNDKKHYEELTALGWNVIVVWECEIEKDLDSVVRYIEECLFENYIQLISRD